jgi:integrase/recombinase XerD
VTDLVPVEPVPSADDERWQRGLVLVGQWLRESTGNTRTAYADAIGWPYTASGAPRSRPPRYGATWLTWCYDQGVHLFAAKRQHVLAWLDDVEEAADPDSRLRLSKRSKAHMMSAVSAFYKWAMQEGHTEVNPAALVNRTKRGLNTSKDPSPSRSLVAEEAQRMIATADTDQVEDVRARSSAIIALLWMTGMRVSELCGATLADMRVQRGRRTLRVHAKGHKDHAYDLVPEVCRRLDAYLASRADRDRLPALRGKASGATVPLFVTNSGKPMNRREVGRLVKRIALQAGIANPSEVHPHVGRHSVIDELRRANVAGDRIQRLVGHAHISTTERYGTGPVDDDSPLDAVARSFAPQRVDEEPDA